MPSEPTWLAADLIIEFNKLIVGETGEPHLLRDEAALENALAKPVNYWAYGESTQSFWRLRCLSASDAIILSCKATSGPRSKRPTISCI